MKLESEQWNKFSVRLESNSALVISINGTDVYRRTLTEAESTEFGFFHVLTQGGIRIRNATLKGDWPSELPADLFATR